MSSRQRGTKGAESRSLRALFARLLNSETGVRFAALYEGEHMLEGGMREGVVSYDPPTVSKEIDIEIAIIGGIAMRWEAWFGSFDHTVLKFGKVNLIFAPIGSKRRFVVMSTEPEVDSTQLVALVKHALKGTS